MRNSLIETWQNTVCVLCAALCVRIYAACLSQVCVNLRWTLYNSRNTYLHSFSMPVFTGFIIRPRPIPSRMIAPRSMIS
ncbi:hypothetical protein FOPG_18764 [Fusarium oxysporum f. sp. conglutinans race 2 54008]|uniref:Uncharacterized protein n=1 Tax=Fusarium oxysporum f. sp. conglutinans race 2 54008 TaxID=1089457 RepID=X0GNW2_FUSOX|nr:hypothetical protein FOPG_18764 [Fusarium oxysporum f. sp. conglutinans race 2 54008]